MFAQFHKLITKQPFTPSDTGVSNASRKEGPSMVHVDVTTQAEGKGANKPDTASAHANGTAATTDTNGKPAEAVTQANGSAASAAAAAAAAATAAEAVAKAGEAKAEDVLPVLVDAKP